MDEERKLAERVTKGTATAEEFNKYARGLGLEPDEGRIKHYTIQRYGHLSAQLDQALNRIKALEDAVSQLEYFARVDGHDVDPD